MEDTGYGKQEWLEERLELPNGIPDSDTFRRVFERLNPAELAKKLQETVNTEGKTVAIDAMGCQKQIAEKICENGADYVLGLKANQPALLQDVKLYFETETGSSQTTTLEKDHDA